MLIWGEELCGESYILTFWALCSEIIRDSVFLSFDESVYTSQETSHHHFGGKLKCKPCFLNLLSSPPRKSMKLVKTPFNAFWKSGEGIMVTFCLPSEFFILLLNLLTYTLARGKELSCLWAVPWGVIQGHRSVTLEPSICSSVQLQAEWNGTCSPIFPCVLYTHTLCICRHKSLIQPCSVLPQPAVRGKQRHGIWSGLCHYLAKNRGRS